MKLSSVELVRTLLISLAHTGLGWDASCVPAVASTPSGTVLDLDSEWRFSKGDFANATILAFDEAAWQGVDLPHDWSGEGPFSAEYGSGNGYAPGGISWYHKHFKVSESDTNKLIAIEFDGVYDHSEVWLNGFCHGDLGEINFCWMPIPLTRCTKTDP